MGIEPKYLSAFFKKATGTTFTRWLTTLRIERAQQYLADDNKRITEVAFLVGFRELGTFERASKRAAGMTPLQFKKAVRPEPIARDHT